MPPDVNYIWIGPPNIAEGQDTIGPDLLRRKYRHQPIHFWCLKEHADVYDKYFNGTDNTGDKIHIHAIEDLIDEKADEYPDLPGFVELLKQSAETQGVTQDVIRERITIKDTMHYFLQLYNSGYFVDTNIIPSPESDLSELATLDHFTIPEVFNTRTFATTPDPWLMYSPPGDKTGERERFETYFHKAVDEFFSRSKTEPVINRKQLGDAFTRTAIESDGVQTETAVSNRPNAPTVLGFQKRYLNTHRASSERHHRYPKLHVILASRAHIDEFQYYFQHATMSPDELYDIPNPNSNGVISTSLLSVAVEIGETALFKFLLSETDNIQVVKTDPKKETLSVLVQHCFNPTPLDSEYDCLEALLEYSFKANQPAKDSFFRTCSILANELSQLYGIPTAPRIEIDSLNTLKGYLTREPEIKTCLEQATQLCLKLGPLTNDNKADYIRAMTQAHRDHHQSLRDQDARFYTPVTDRLYTLFGHPPAPLPPYRSAALNEKLGVQLERESKHEGEVKPSRNTPT